MCWCVVCLLVCVVVHVGVLWPVGMCIVVVWCIVARGDALVVQ